MTFKARYHLSSNDKEEQESENNDKDEYEDKGDDKEEDKEEVDDREHDKAEDEAEDKVRGNSGVANKELQTSGSEMEVCGQLSRLNLLL